jgi:hypothetical protein
MARNAIVIATHAPYSSDLVPYDFYLFGHVKGLFRGESFETGEQLLSAIEGNLRSLAPSQITKVISDLNLCLSSQLEHDRKRETSIV